MEKQTYKPGRPNFLRRDPGILDFMYDAWCKTTQLFTGTPPAPQKPDSPYKVETPSELRPK